MTRAGTSPAPAQPAAAIAFVNRESIIHRDAGSAARLCHFLCRQEVTPANETAFRFELAGAPDASSYSHRITGPAAGCTHGLRPRPAKPYIEGIDVSGLADGTLTFTLRVISKRGAAGPEVTARIVKSTAALGVSASALSSPTTMSPIRCRSCSAARWTGSMSQAST